MVVVRLSPAVPAPAMIVRKAARVISAGGVILYPTDTVYGLGCDALNAASINRLFEIKRRPENRPVLLLVRDRAMLDTLVAEIPPLAVKLMERFWPGPLTIIFRARSELHPLLTGGAGKVGVRLPKHEFCRRLLAVAGVPIVSTSANISDEKADQEIEALRLRFAGVVDLVIDAGPPVSTLPSTVVDVSGGSVELVREGVIPSSVLLETVNFDGFPKNP